MADLLLMPNLAGISVQYLLLLFGAEDAAANSVYVTILGCGFIVAMCWICWRGIEVSARTQVALLGTELVVLGVFAVVSIVGSFGGVTRTINGITYSSARRSLSWLWPSGVSMSAVVAGLVVAVFAYWGWDTAVSVNEGCEDANRIPGIAAVLSVFILLGIYVLTSFGTQAFLGSEFAVDNSDDAVYAVGKPAGPWRGVQQAVDHLILTSAAAIRGSLAGFGGVGARLRSRRARPRGGALEDELAAVGNEALDSVRDLLTAAHPSLLVEVELVRDRPVDSLLRVAAARDAEVIVVGHGGRGPMAGHCSVRSPTRSCTALGCRCW